MFGAPPGRYAQRKSALAGNTRPLVRTTVNTAVKDADTKSWPEQGSLLSGINNDEESEGHSNNQKKAPV